MSTNFLSNINLNKNELQNIVLHKAASAPSNPKEGQMYYNTNDRKIYRYNGTNWIACQDADGNNNLFIANSNTTYQEIEDAYSLDKTIFYDSGTSVYLFAGTNVDEDAFIFSGGFTGSNAEYIEVNYDNSTNLHSIVLAGINSPTFTGIPKAPTATEGTNTTQIATTAFVQSAIQGAGSGLPSVTSSDNGKVLTVVNGAWAAASLPLYDGTVV